MGIPVIAPKTKVISHYFDDELLLYYQADKPDLIVNILDKIADAPEILLNIREKEKLYRANYSWVKGKKKYKEIVYSLMASKSKK